MRIQFLPDTPMVSFSSGRQYCPTQPRMRAPSTPLTRAARPRDDAEHGADDEEDFADGYPCLFGHAHGSSASRASLGRDDCELDAGPRSISGKRAGPRPQYRYSHTFLSPFQVRSEGHAMMSGSAKRSASGLNTVQACAIIVRLPSPCLVVSFSCLFLSCSDHSTHSITHDSSFSLHCDWSLRTYTTCSSTPLDSS